MEAFMIGCDQCDRWYHGHCCGVTEEQADLADVWLCPDCDMACDMAVKATLERLITRCERQYLHSKEAKLARALAIKQEAWDSKAVAWTVEWLVEQVARTAGDSREDAAATPSRSRLLPSVGGASVSGAAKSTLPTALRPAADGGYYLERIYIQSGFVFGRLESSAGAAAKAASAAAGANSMAASSAAGKAFAVYRAAGSATGAGAIDAGAMGDESLRCPLLDALTPDCLDLILSKLTVPSLLLSVVPTCHRLAAVCEAAFAEHARRQGWRLGRRAARGATSSHGNGGPQTHSYPWRQLLHSSTCAACLSPAANYPVRSATPGCPVPVIVAKLCGACARGEPVRAYAASVEAEIDSVGLDGKALSRGGVPRGRA